MAGHHRSADIDKEAARSGKLKRKHCLCSRSSLFLPVHLLQQILPALEERRALGLHVNILARVRVASLAGAMLAHLEGAEAADLNAVAPSMSCCFIMSIVVSTTLLASSGVMLLFSARAWMSSDFFMLV